MPSNTTDDNQCISALKDVSLLAIKEVRAARRWRVTFRIIILLILAFIFLPSSWHAYHRDHSMHVFVARLNGVISDKSQFNARDTINTMESALSDPLTKALIMLLNSPGGSPVQAKRIYDSIIRLREKYPNKPIYAVIDDICASGCYYVASAASKIISSPVSILGSIGVIMQGFGMVELIKKLGIENRTIASGKNKDFLDPFAELNPDHIKIAKDIIKKSMNVFVNDVKAGRDNKLKGKNEELFSGKVWLGIDAIHLGLVDELGDIDSITKKEFPNSQVVYQNLDEWPQSLLKKIDYEFTGNLVSQYLVAHMR
ncbi:signal peptide peptidase SppA [Candidatus Ichthyocystis hellenicum]|uniref:signal peptide peptidase SppA n=1 Tax=Candidatus Ichthyocystis hellenicum TaxID=1561003 RepID=UPI000B80813A|nr:signal peptide peptidase SppA [Candidatus Ichthyocystis hellenicum]